MANPEKTVEQLHYEVDECINRFNLVLAQQVAESGLTEQVDYSDWGPERLVENSYPIDVNSTIAATAIAGPLFDPQKDTHC